MVFLEYRRSIYIEIRLTMVRKCRTVPVGTQIEYKGTDYLRIDLSTRLIYNVTSSSDLLNYYTQLGDNVIAGK